MIKEVDIDGNGTFSRIKFSDLYMIFCRWNRLWWVPGYDGKKIERNGFRDADNMIRISVS